jgi:S-DNA-T family DNA segregation ATPase FtsK/SpoIIIE
VAVRGRRLSPAIRALSGILIFLSVLCLLTLALHLMGMPGPGAAPGRLLMELFSWAAFFIPLYFIFALILLVAPVFRRRSALMLMLSIFPFLTASLLLLVVGGSALSVPDLLLSSFGMIPSAILLSLLLALEIIFLFTLPFGLTTAIEGARSAPLDKRKKMKLLPPVGDPALHKVVEPPGEDPPIEVEAEVVEPEPLHRQVPPQEPASERAQRQKQALQQPKPAQPAPSPGELPAPVPAQPELPFGSEAGGKSAYGIPADEVLKVRGDDAYWEIDDETRRASHVLTDALQEFNIQAEVTGIRKGPVITLFEVLPAPGVRVSKIANLSDNIALRLAAPSVRIVAPIPGKHAVGIEVPNKRRAIVSFREMISMPPFSERGEPREGGLKTVYEIPVALGKDILGEAQVIDLVQTPHLLIGGATNSGKSVLVNAVISSILFKKSPEEVRLFLIDPKIVELKSYNGVPHLLTPVITEPRKAFQALQYCISEMERRYTLLDALAVRDIRAFNKKAKREKVHRLPYIVIVIDEFADLMATTGKELESTLARLAAMSRAVGIHMVLATQRPSIDVITGLIKANIPSRIAFMVANKFDSRIIIDCVGAEKLLGKGDMLFSAAWNPFPVRIQGAYVDDEETEAITEYVKKLGPPQYIDDEVFFDDDAEGRDYEGEPGNDPLFEKALEIVIAQGKASASYLQRRLKVGYNRAARLVEEMEMRGIVGPAQGSKPREIIHVPKGGA